MDAYLIHSCLKSEKRVNEFLTIYAPKRIIVFTDALNNPLWTESTDYLRKLNYEATTGTLLLWGKEQDLSCTTFTCRIHFSNVTLHGRCQFWSGGERYVFVQKYEVK